MVTMGTWLMWKVARVGVQAAGDRKLWVDCRVPSLSLPRRQLLACSPRFQVPTLIPMWQVPSDNPGERWPEVEQHPGLCPLQTWGLREHMTPETHRDRPDLALGPPTLGSLTAYSRAESASKNQPGQHQGGAQNHPRRPE